MDEKKKGCSIGCFTKYRFELFGILLIGLATILTIISMDSLGIVAMFFIGAVLCCHQCYIKGKLCNEQEAMPKKANKPRRRPAKTKPSTTEPKES